MKKLFFLISLIIISSSCTESNSSEKQIIKKFEKTLGKQETIYLKEILHDFDTYLIKKYPNGNLDAKYKAYLKEIYNAKTIKYWTIDSSKQTKYKKNSNLFAKLETKYLDSVWSNGNNSIKYIFDKNFIDSPNTIVSFKNINTDSLINVYKNKLFTFLKEPSNFYHVISSIKHRDSLVFNFLEVKEIAPISLDIIAEAFYKLDSNHNYFSKSIFIMESNDPRNCTNHIE